MSDVSSWSRDQSNRTQLEQQYPDIDPRFLFINTGYNMRPLEIQGAMGICQLKSIQQMNTNRKENYTRLVERVKSHPRYDNICYSSTKPWLVL